MTLNLDEQGSHRDCAKCRRDIYVRPRHNPYHVTCAICDKFFHVFCVFIEREALNNISLNNDWYMCDKCKIDIFPFQELSKFELKRIFFLNDITDFDDLPDFLDSDFFNNYGLDESNDEGLSLNLKPTAYFTADSMHKKIDSNPNKFSFLHVNVNSLNEKYHGNLCDLLEPINNKINIIAVSETRLKTTSDFQNLSIPGYKPLSPDFCDFSDTLAGGVALYIDEHLDAFPRPDLKIKLPSCENVWFEINQKSEKNIIFGIIYRHPKKIIDNILEFTESLEKVLEKINLERKISFITGDINLNLLDTNGPGIANHCNMLFSNIHLPLVSKPTRIVPHHKPSLLDHFYSNAFDSDIETGICLYPISDGHLPIFGIIDIKPDLIDKTVFIRNFKKFNAEEFRRHLRFGLSDFLGSNTEINDPNILFDKFFSVFISTLNAHAPIKKLTPKELKIFHKPWITKGILKSIKNRSKMYRQFFLFGDINMQAYYKRYSNLLTHIKEKSKKLYYEKKFEDLKGNIKKTWKTINSIVNIRKSKRNTLTSIKSNDEIISDPHIIANSFNEFFRNIGPKLARNIPKSNLSHREFLKNPIQETFLAENCTSNEISDIINNLKNTKSCGTDNVPTSVVKLTKDIISEPLCMIFNCSFTTGIFPNILKVSKIIPVHKADSTTNVNNYRPISLLSCFSKVLEKLMYKRLIKFLNANNILYNFQFGFRLKHSTSLALLEATDQIYKSLDESKFFLALYLDLSKAFDTVDLNILMDKLEFYGIRGNELSWFESYIFGRKQYVEIDGKLSDPLTTVCGVPQGSTLGPLLFLLYINDMPNCSDVLNFRLFADDTKVFISDSDLSNIQKILDSEIPKLNSWLSVNRLSLNVSKTNFIIYKPPNKTENVEINLLLANSTIKRSKSKKYLGLIFDQAMSWKSHIEYITQKISSAIGVMYRLKNYVNSEILRNVYYSIAFSHLNYGISSWGSAPPTNLNELQRKQNHCIRVVYDLDRMCNRDNMYFNNKFLKVNEIYHSECLKFVYKYHNNNIPLAFNSYFSYASDVHRYNTRYATNFNFQVPIIHKNFGIRSPSYTGLKLWSQILPAAKSFSENQFKRYIFNFLLSRYSK